ncbi:tetratricopeptide repeat protein [Methylosinus sp. H3A]|uniref:tetratricopeptide repeat protein n=1 Tax=Methylosinus sp. H3A TaxID=2785786 RepID=UPI001AEF144F|nr:tetratricopeptide repeat protein [Methylosinus sp. H3A]
MSRYMRYTPSPSTQISDRLFRAIDFHQNGLLSHAEKIYLLILAEDAAQVTALHLLGVIMIQTDRLERGMELFDKALSIKPDDPDMLYIRGNALQMLKRFEEAVTSYDKAIAIAPDYADAHFNRANTLQMLKRLDEAVMSYDRALSINPDYVDAVINRGNALQELGRLDGALAAYDKALSIKPSYAVALVNRGGALQELKRFAEALASYDHALSIKPDFTEAHYNRGNALLELKRLDEASASYDKALSIQPDYADALYNRGLLALLRGDFIAGWSGYESRWDRKKAPRRGLLISCPTWGGEDVVGKRIIVYDEQGLGDVIQFCRYFLYLAASGADVTFFVRYRLLGLMRHSIAGVRFVPSLPEGEAFDYQCALLSLPFAFGSRLKLPPGETPYLRAEVERVRKWKARLGGQGFKIGIAWQGSKAGKIDNGRSFALAEFLAISRLPNVRLISLQKNEGVEQLRELLEGMTVETLGDDYDADDDAFADSVAVMESLDLVISCDTSIAHLAGALARPVWLAVKYVPDWRWMLDRTDSPWYPTMRLFRQQTRDDWRSVFSDIESALRELMDKERQRTKKRELATPRAPVSWGRVDRQNHDSRNQERRDI